MQLSPLTTGHDLERMLTGPQQSKRMSAEPVVLSPIIESVQTNHLSILEPRQAGMVINPFEVCYFWGKVSISFAHNIDSHMLKLPRNMSMFSQLAYSRGKWETFKRYVASSV